MKIRPTFNVKFSEYPELPEPKIERIIDELWEKRASDQSLTSK